MARKGKRVNPNTVKYDRMSLNDRDNLHVNGLAVRSNLTHNSSMNIKGYLKAQGVSAADITNVKLADIVGVSESTIKRELARGDKMDIDYIVAIVDHFGISRTKALQALGVLEQDEPVSVSSLSQVAMLRELLSRAEESDPDVVQVTEFPALADHTQMPAADLDSAQNGVIVDLEGFQEDHKHN